MTSSANSMPSSETRLLIERLIGEVAERHNVLIGAEDPIFISVTLNERLLAETVARLKADIVASQNLIAAGTAEQLATAKTLSERLVTAAAGHVTREMRATAHEVAEMVRHAMIAELDEMRASLTKMQELHAATRRAGLRCSPSVLLALPWRSPSRCRCWLRSRRGSWTRRICAEPTIVPPLSPHRPP